MSECKELEPEEGDYLTEDHRRFWQYDKLVLALPEHVGWQAAIRAHMDRERFWPNVWFVSDHGNAHLLTLKPENP